MVNMRIGSIFAHGGKHYRITETTPVYSEPVIEGDEPTILSWSFTATLVHLGTDESGAHRVLDVP